MRYIDSMIDGLIALFIILAFVALMVIFRVVFWGLVTQFRQFGLSKINVKTVATQMLSQTHVILLSARGNGLRDFLTKTHSVQESIVRNANDQRGFFSGFTNLFKRNQEQ